MLEVGLDSVFVSDHFQPWKHTGGHAPYCFACLGALGAKTSRAVSRWIVSGDPEEQVEKIRPYLELGIRHLVFRAPSPDQARFVRLHSGQVLPRLRRAFG